MRTSSLAKDNSITTVTALDTREHRAAIKALCVASEDFEFGTMGALACSIKAQIGRRLHATDDEPEAVAETAEATS